MSRNIVLVAVFMIPLALLLAAGCTSSDGFTVSSASAKTQSSVYVGKETPTDMGGVPQQYIMDDATYAATK